MVSTERRKLPWISSRATIRTGCRTGYVENLDDGKLCWASRAIYNWRRFARPHAAIEIRAREENHRSLTLDRLGPERRRTE